DRGRRVGLSRPRTILSPGCGKYATSQGPRTTRVSTEPRSRGPISKTKPSLKVLSARERCPRQLHVLAEGATHNPQFRRACISESLQKRSALTVQSSIR